MSRLKDEYLGYYIPAFFEMHVDTHCEDLTPNRLPIEDMTVLFHEYIHFIQDFTTYYGLNSIYVYSEYLHSVVNRIKQDQRPGFSVPYTITDNSDNVLLNRQVSVLTQGDSEESDSFVVEDVTIENDQLEPNNLIKELPSVIINPNGDIRSFGALAIMENMAYLMERLCSPNGYVTSPDYPYCAAELVADYYVKDFSKEPIKVLALCDMCLQNSNPGLCFVNVMKGIRDKNVSFSSPEEIYDYFYAQKAVMADGTVTSFLTSLKSFLSIVQGCLKSYLRNMPICKDYYRWIDNLVDFAIDWRENDRYFLLKMARNNNLASNGCWGYVVHRVGSPLMTNSNGHYFKIPQDTSSGGMDVEYFKAFQQILNLFESGYSACELHEWCQQSPGLSPNPFCLSSPWENCSKEKAELCPYALVWRHWGLMGKKPCVQTV